MNNISWTNDFSFVNEHTNYNLRNKNNVNKITPRINVRKKLHACCGTNYHLIFRTVSGYRCFQSKVISLFTE